MPSKEMLTCFPQWCYIGKRNLDRAIELFNKTYPSNDRFTLTYRPYYLSYVTPESSASSLQDGSALSVPKAEMAELKLAGVSQERRDVLKKKMNGLGAAAGIKFKYGGLIGRSRDAHRLVHVASSSSVARSVQEGDSPVADALVEGILRAFHEEERDIADRTVLRDIAAAAGMKSGDIDQAFRSDEVGRVVDEQAERYRDMIKGAGVPTYYINGQRVDGSQDPGDWYELFIKIKEGEDMPSQQGVTCA